MTKSADIYEELVRLGTPSRLPGLWGNVTCDPAIFDLPPNSVELIRNLEAHYKRRDLVMASVLAEGPDQVATLSPLLATNREFLTALRKHPDGKPYDLLIGAAGSLAGEWAWSQALDEGKIQSRIARERGRLFLAESAADVAVLRSLDLPAMPAAELDCLLGERLARFSQALGIDRAQWEDGAARESAPEESAAGKSRKGKSPGAKSRSRKSGPGKSGLGKSSAKRSSLMREPRLPISLVIANWSPATLDRCDQPRVLKVQQHLLRLRDDQALTLVDHLMWKPSEEKLAAVEEYLRSGQEQRASDVLLDDLEADCALLDRGPPGDASEGDSYADALGKIGVGAEGMLSMAPSDDLERLRKLQHSKIIAPLLEAACQTEDPIDKNAFSTLAHLSRVFHDEVATAPSAERHAKLPLLLALASAQLDLTKEIRRWN